MDSRDIRQLWTRFFEERGHKPIPSASLVPAGDPTLLFTSAGMVQLKPYMMGLAEPPARRLLTIQKCFRTSDIEEVGDDSHCTFFEMMGNFSIGDYFKPDVIPWAWELLTAPQPQGLGLAKDRIWTTIFLDDEEAFDLWRKVGVPAQRIVRYGEKDNYWFSGPVGPCGPNTEINYDFGADQGCRRPDCHPNCENPLPDGSGPCNRFIEIWNLVFMTLYQAEDGTRTPLPQRNVDTGAGLDRWPMPLLWEGGVDWQGRPKRWERPPSIYDNDLFQPILARAAEIADKSYVEANEVERRAMRVVTEHARAATFLIADGVTPSNDGRGYVLRRMIRRATSFGQRLVPGRQFLEGTAEAVIDAMGLEYERLRESRPFVLQVLKAEESRFFETLWRGTEMLQGMVSYRERHGDGVGEVVSFAERYKPDAENAASILEQHGFTGWDSGANANIQAGEEIAAERISSSLHAFLENPTKARLYQVSRWPNALSSEELFYLYDTFGFPPELAAELARESGLRADLSEFSALMESQQTRSRAATRFEADAERLQAYARLGLPASHFVGYETLSALSSVAAIMVDGEPVDALAAASGEGKRVEIVLDQTPFYAEGGGQVGDRGEITWSKSRDSDSDGVFYVEDTKSVGEGGVIAHLGRLLKGQLSTGDPVEAHVDHTFRADIMRNHTATHILHAALRQVLGTHVRQAGSLVAPDRLRFDFTHLEALKPSQLEAVEEVANRAVRENLPVHIHYEKYEEALKGGALAFFGDKYADTVRVVEVCDVHGDDCFSKELCGGTHCQASGDVGAILITSETSIGAGMRRIEAVTGRAAVHRVRRHEEVLAGLSASLHALPEELPARIEGLQEELDSLRKHVQTLERRGARDEAETLAAKAQQIGGVNVVAARVEAPNADVLRELGDGLKARLGSAAIILGAEIGGRPSFLAMATPDVARRLPAGDLVRVAAQTAGGGGGGRPELAQGGGTDLSLLDAALAAALRLAEERLL